MHHQTLRRLLRFLFRKFTRVQLDGMQNFPLTGGLIAATNHLSWVDGPLVYAMLPREDATALAADKYQRNPFSRWLLDSARVIWIDRENPDAQAMKKAIRFLRDGGVLGIAPEGTRSRSGALIPAKAGGAYLATKAEVPLIPVAVYGTETAFGELLRLRRPVIHMVIGEPFQLPPLDKQNRDETLRRNADELMCRIAELLPRKYHGAYAEHPRLKELLAR